jgi:ribosomal protein S18 acetylase RimI-like enzyme
LAGEVEHWFGAMIDDPGFRAVIDRHIRWATALVAAAPGETDLVGGLLFSAQPPTCHVQWLVVFEHAGRRDIGRALMTEVTLRFPRGQAIVEVVTFGADRPGAAASGARAFYERLGFTAAGAAAPGPEGGSRQAYRKTITCPEAPAWS